MSWSPQQEAALKSVKEWLKSGTKKQQVFRLDGFAGTGKTTLAKHMADMVKGDVNYATLSGKAASVLQSKGCVGAQTIHSLIYRPDESDPKHLKWVLRARDTETPSPLYNASLLVLDEVSMVGEDIGVDLLSFDVPILAIGDPAQLPPIEGGGFFQQGKADIALTEIHRQAKDSPIIDMATKVREGDLLAVKDYGEGNRVIPLSEYRDHMFADGVDQILCGKHKNRQRFNRMFREQFGVADYIPLPNDKLICLSNDRENRSLLNGTMWYVRELLKRNEFQQTNGQIPLRLWSEDNSELTADVLTTEEMFSFKTPKQIAEIRKSVGFQHFDYGYAITVHKAQGSQWDNVVVFDDGWEDFEDKTFRYKWLYTAITRAAKTVTILGDR